MDDNYKAGSVSDWRAFPKRGVFNRARKVGCSAVAGLCLSLALAASAAAQSDTADTVLTNGRIYTVNDDQPWAEAVAVKGDEIIYVGDKEGAEALTGDRTTVIDLEGRLTLPGFIEGHVHATHAAAFSSGAPLDFSDSIEEVVQKIKKFAEANPDREVIFGATYNGAHTVGNTNFAAMLDAVVPDRPVYLVDHGSHGAWVNSKTLEVAGINKDSVDPHGAFYGRLENGEPNGALRGGSAHINLQNIMPVFPLEALSAAIPNVMESMNEFGFTAALEMGQLIAPEASNKALQDLARSGGLTVRLSVTAMAGNNAAMMPAIKMVERSSAINSDVLWYDTVKFVFDGVIELETAAMLAPYIHNGSKGAFYIDAKPLRDAAFEVAKRGYHITVHAYGDLAVRTFLDLAEELRDAGYTDTRISIAHGGFIDAIDRPRFAELNVMYETTPVWVFDNSEEYLPTLGADRYDKLGYPMRDVIDGGGKVVLGSDWPATIGGYEWGLNPFTNIFHAMTRRTAAELVPVWGTTNAPMPPLDQVLTLDEAIRGYTLWGAERIGKENMIGSIEVSKKADIIVLDRDLFTLLDIEDTVHTKVVMTMFDGRVVHDLAFGVGDSARADIDALDDIPGDHTEVTPYWVQSISQ